MWFYGEMKGKRNHKEQSLEKIKSKYGSQTFKSKEKEKLKAGI